MGTQQKLTDESIMPYGKYSKANNNPTEMADVPAEYLMWLYDNDKCSGQVRWYIEDNMDALKEELK